MLPWVHLDSLLMHMPQNKISKRLKIKCAKRNVKVGGLFFLRVFVEIVLFSVTLQLKFNCREVLLIYMVFSGKPVLTFQKCNGKTKRKCSNVFKHFTKATCLVNTWISQIFVLVVRA